MKLNEQLTRIREMMSLICELENIPAAPTEVPDAKLNFNMGDSQQSMSGQSQGTTQFMSGQSQGTTQSMSGQSQGTAEWLKFPGDKKYLYKKENDKWVAKVVRTGKILDLSKYPTTIEKLNKQFPNVADTKSTNTSGGQTQGIPAQPQSSNSGSLNMATGV